jgi:hypothetical protein
MPHAEFSAAVAAPAAVVWGLVHDKIEHPERFVPGVTAVEIRSRAPDGSVVRAMTVADGSRVVERVTADVGTLTVRFVAEPDSEGPPGEVLNAVVATGGLADPGPVGLRFEARWSEPDDTGSRAVLEPAAVAAMLRAAVLRTKQTAEAAPGPA